MSFCTYIASDTPLPQSALLWPLSRGGEDIYTQRQFLAQIDPDLEDLAGLLSYIQWHMKSTSVMEIWHIWQGVEFRPVIRSQTICIQELSLQHLAELKSKDVLATATQYEIPVQYRIVIVK